jgi:hypothetical protein
MGMACSTNGEKRNAYTILMGRLEGKRPLGRPRRWWMDNIKIDLKVLFRSAFGHYWGFMQACNAT